MSRGKLGASYRKLFAASTISNLGDGIGTIAYPWLASAVTRNPLLVAIVVVVQRLPWLLFSLPAGVITDRYERRMLMVVANTARAVLTGAVALLVLIETDSLPSPDQLDDAGLVIDTNLALYLVVVIATLLIGTAEVLYDNTAQTIMPSLVRDDQLEQANGRLTSAELVMNTMAGPAAAGVLLAIAFSLPFFVDAVTFAVAAVLIALIPRAAAAAKQPVERRPWKQEMTEGFRWLWQHELLRPLAITLGLLNMVGMFGGATLVLFAQEVLGTSSTEFALLSTGMAIGGVAGGWTASWVSERLGPGRSLMLVLASGGVTTLIVAASSDWPIVWLMFVIYTFTGTVWNVITVSLRQSIIPDDLLGRVNSVYRFFGWGMMPIGALIGGLIIVVGEAVGSREFALRLPWIAGALGELALIAYAGPRLTTAAIERARESAAAGRR